MNTNTLTTTTTLAPYLCVKDAPAAIDFYKQAFGAVEIFRLNDEMQRRYDAMAKS